METLYDKICYYASHHGDYEAIIGKGIKKNYIQFKDDIDIISGYLSYQGLKIGDRVSLIMPPTYLHIVLSIALDRLGVATHSYSFTTESLLGQKWRHDMKFTYVFSMENKPKGYDGKWVAMRSMPDAESFQGYDNVLTDRNPDTITRLATSSGTTGMPKVMEFSREMVLRRSMELPDCKPEEGKSRVFAGMPPDIFGGYGFLLSTFLLGCSLVLWNQQDDFWVLLNKFKPDYLMLTPMALRSIATHGASQNARLDFVKWVASGGMIFDMRFRQDIEKVFGKTVINGYGSTEVHGVAYGWVHEYGEGDAYLIGKLLPYAEVQIVDEHDNILPNGAEGHVRSRSKYNISGYMGDTSQDNFRNGYFYPGDIGALDDQGRLSILGRADDLVNIGGQKILPDPVEKEILAIRDIKETAIFQVNTKNGLQVCAALVLKDDSNDPQNHQAIIKKVKEHLGRLAPQRIVFVSELPRNALGKVMRRELAKSFSKMA